MTALLTVLGVVLVLAVWLAAIYNNFIKNRNLVKEGWSGIQVQLKRRADLIPNLLETVKGYMGHERGVLEKVTALRARSLDTHNVEARGQLEGALSRSLVHLFAVAEGYPDLKANTNFLDLQAQLSQLEEQIQTARRYYNGTVRDYNIRVESFPSNLVAQFFGFSLAEFFEITEEADRTVPQAVF
jgi:LemA protein